LAHDIISNKEPPNSSRAELHQGEAESVSEQVLVPRSKYIHTTRTVILFQLYSMPIDRKRKEGELVSEQVHTYDQDSNTFSVV
jgi:hypothetical protein